MMRTALVLSLLTPCIFAQAPSRPEFEVASVKASAPAPLGQMPIGIHVDGAQVHCTQLALRDYIRSAFLVKDHQIEGPDFMRTERFDISAKLPEGASGGQVGKMIQALLEDRFGLKFHRESKEFNVYGLVVDKNGLKAKPSPLEADTGTFNVTSVNGPTGTTIDLGKGAYFFLGEKTLECRKLGLAQLADVLARFVDRPVVDLTGTSGTFDLTLEFKPEEFLTMKIRAAVVAGVQLPPEALKLLDNASDDSLFSALAQQGLRLERRKAPIEVLVVDHIEKVPTAN